MIFIKKQIVACLCIILAASSLSACSRNKPTDETTQPTTQEAESLFFHLDSLPDIGERKDNSFVNKYFGGEAKNEFIPDENYKGIVPYVFSQQTYSAYGDEVCFNEYSYGLATIEGEIVTNGIYETVYLETSSDNKQIYICTEGVANENDSEVFVDVIAADGSWKIRDKIPNDIGVSTDCDLITVKNTIGSKVYDFDGNLIFDSQELFGEGFTAAPSDKIGDNIVFKVSDKKNIFYVSIEDEYEEQRTVYAACVDRSGKIVYTVKSEEYRFSNVCGNHLEFSKYESVYDEYGNSYHELDNALFDKNGNKLLDDYDFIEYDEISDLYVLTPKDDKPLKVIDRDMKEICQIETNGYGGSILRCNGESCLEVYYYPDEEKSGGKDGSYFYDLKTGKETEFSKNNKNKSFEINTIEQWKGDTYILINDGQYVSVCDIKGRDLKKLSAPYIEINDIRLEDDIFYYVADSKLYVETLDNCTTFDLKSNVQYSSWVKFSGGDLIYLALNDNSTSYYSEGGKLDLVYNKSTGELKQTSKTTGLFNTQNGIFTVQETDYYLNLLNENGECLIRKTKSF